MSTRRAVSHSTSAGGVSGGVGFGGTRQPSPVFASSCIRGRATSFRSSSDWPSLRHEGVDIDQLPDLVAGAVGDPGRDHAAIAVADQHDVAQILVLDDIQHVLDMRIEIDRWIGQMRALAETRCRSASPDDARPPASAGASSSTPSPRTTRRDRRERFSKELCSSGRFHRVIVEGFDCDSTCPPRRVNVAQIHASFRDGRTRN